MDDLLFDARTPLGFSVRCTRPYWDLISSQKHPVMAGKHDEVRRTLEEPGEIRVSRRDPQVHLFYRGGPPRWTCAVARVTDRIKVGFELLHYRPAGSTTGLSVETVVQAGA